MVNSCPNTASDADSDRLLHLLLRVILVAAVVSAPLFLFGEGFEAEYLGRVAASNGACVVLCVALLALAKRGRSELAARALVGGLMLLVGGLAWTNGEPVHVNVINFVLVTVLASVLLSRNAVALVAAFSAGEMALLGWTRPLMGDGRDLAEARFESLVQILPTFLVVSVVLWLSARRGRAATR